ncbi:MAG: Re/Si-specific NAD(P)(+) transhydrogenase subunit alpha [Actinobacteria bacterium]|nr:Re/Si-specific NAD(P)(+) transhydrogenase subunit alpha [Actinomycetota bacterium]MSW26398.1 Re/Si-specific NAD(P)(+) transhydrogenase subunit alpha [Actinomycetota bacterium]MSW34549.1 Re/Si-specific NAD(P)(+) transhydrogenase subunit alpha [Actinomycetota bacterium]MSX31275.1 Re/Si-specific NAD(P)(+) transhydrogenase subunit alpha [Actinomycetota bacterium]MSX51805.1 Re/Si-specific NAD(P)(+) transhydrogenase subunit alpha [Actinomycetota bacterium]
MRVCVPTETRVGEKRVALVPDIINKLIRLGLDVSIQSGAGLHAQASDSEYEKAGATVVSGDVLKAADIVLSVQPLTPEQMATLKKGAITISFLSIATAQDSIDAAIKAGVTVFSLELVPRISRAQSMDALSSQALCAGYRAALVGAELSPRFFPLLMTAAGTVTPAQVLVLGAGVAGLQAIATARRLGAVVSAYDVRPASADEVKSMGATFIQLELESLEGAGGYAREMTEERAAKQRELLTPFIAKSHVLITTAAVPGRIAPRLVTKAMVDAMAPGTVIVDLAAETGGNVEGSKPGEIVTTAGGVRIWGGKDVPSQLPFHASMLYSRNVVNILTLMTKDGVVAPDFEDEIIAGSVVVHNGELKKEVVKK